MNSLPAKELIICFLTFAFLTFMSRAKVCARASVGEDAPSADREERRSPSGPGPPTTTRPEGGANASASGRPPPPEEQATGRMREDDADEQSARRRDAAATAEDEEHVEEDLESSFNKRKSSSKSDTSKETALTDEQCSNSNSSTLKEGTTKRNDQSTKPKNQDEGSGGELVKESASEGITVTNEQSNAKKIRTAMANHLSHVDSFDRGTPKALKSPAPASPPSSHPLLSVPIRHQNVACEKTSEREDGSNAGTSDVSDFGSFEVAEVQLPPLTPDSSRQSESSHLRTDGDICKSSTSNEGGTENEASAPVESDLGGLTAGVNASERNDDRADAFRRNPGSSLSSSFSCLFRRSRSSSFNASFEEAHEAGSSMAQFLQKSFSFRSMEGVVQGPPISDQELEYFLSNYPRSEPLKRLNTTTSVEHESKKMRWDLPVSSSSSPPLDVEDGNSAIEKYQKTFKHDDKLEMHRKKAGYVFWEDATDFDRNMSGDAAFVRVNDNFLSKHLFDSFNDMPNSTGNDLLLLRQKLEDNHEMGDHFGPAIFDVLSETLIVCISYYSYIELQKKIKGLRDSDFAKSEWEAQKLKQLSRLLLALQKIFGISRIVLAYKVDRIEFIWRGCNPAEPSDAEAFTFGGIMKQLSEDHFGSKKMVLEDGFLTEFCRSDDQFFKHCNESLKRSKLPKLEILFGSSFKDDAP